MLYSVLVIRAENRLSVTVTNIELKSNFVHILSFAFKKIVRIKIYTKLRHLSLCKN